MRPRTRRSLFLLLLPGSLRLLLSLLLALLLVLRLLSLLVLRLLSLVLLLHYFAHLFRKKHDTCECCDYVNC